jgi:hypothetical protein
MAWVRGGAGNWQAGIVPPCSTSPPRSAPSRALAEIGMREADLERAADLAAEEPYPNPTPITRAGLRALLDDAFHGRRPVISGPA